MLRSLAITHVKADFDAVASAWAACRLYGCDGIAVATDMEPGVACFLEEAPCSPIISMKPADIESIGTLDHLIITDCKQKKRIGLMEPLLAKASRITIFDHHPAYAKDIEADDPCILPLGAATTVALTRLLETGTEITPYEATLYLLGIYEDTGLLTFSTTTPEDVRVVARLIELGGDVSRTADFIKRDLNRDQVFLLNELLMNMTTVNIRGINVTYSHASIDEYTEELAYIAHRMMDMEGLESLFILVRTGPQIVLVGRSKNPAVDAGKITTEFGGGGHPSAASANIRDKELFEALDSLKAVLNDQVNPVCTVAEVMTYPAKSIDIDTTFEQGLDYTVKHNLNHLPVTDKGRVAGIISRKDLMHGVKHHMAKEAVSLVMNVEFETVEPDTPFRRAEEIIVSLNQKLLPVVEDGRLAGVVTRTDLFRMMQEQALRRSSYEEGTRARLGLSPKRNVKDILQLELTRKRYKLLQEIGEIGVAEEAGIYIVGGFVRDLLLGHPCEDLDFVVEGDALRIAELYAAKKSGRLSIHDHYKTASVNLPDGTKVDFATSRTEYYSMPAALPVVEFSSLRNDLSRRDFTINAMAVKIDGPDFGQLIDYFGGQRDLMDKQLRVLHSLSFVDDPTRAFRAVRFAARFMFRLGTHTERLLKHAESTDLFSRLSGIRLFTELKYILMERRYFDALLLLQKYKLLRFITDNLSIQDSKKEQFEHLDDVWRKTQERLDAGFLIWRPRFVVLLNNCKPAEYEALLKKLNMDGAMAESLRNLYYKSRQTAKALKGMKAPRPSEIYRLLENLNDEELLTACALSGEKRSYIIVSFMENDRNIRPALNGDDLIKMGIPQSKLIGDILEELLYARLDGKIASKEQEEEYVENRKRETGI